jgi:hypothetical protein
MVVNERLLHVVASVSQQRGQGEPSDATSAGLSTGDDDADPPSQDELFDVLSNRRRRYAVDVEQVSYDERKRVYTALQQSHLPMMDNAGVVEFDKNRGTVEATSALEDVEVYMDVVHGNEIPWSVYYLGLSGVAASLMAAVWAGAWPFSLFPDAAWGVAVVAMFAVSAVAHTYYARGQRIGETEAPPELNT